MKCTLILIALAISHVVYCQHADSIAAARSHRFARALAVPSILVTSGLAVRSANEKIQRYFYDDDDGPRHMPRNISDFTQFAPLAMVFVFNATGNDGEHKFLKMTSLAVQSEILMIAFTRPLKMFVHEERPDGGSHSFPSGHTAQAFMAATVLHKEYGGKSIWYSVTGYTMATAVGTCRMMGNKHWASDVLAGAGIGILSTNLVYLYHKHRDARKMQITALPSYNRGNAGFFVQMKL